MLVCLQSTEVLDSFLHGGGGPSQGHRGRAPVFDVAAADRNASRAQLRFPLSGVSAGKEFLLWGGLRERPRAAAYGRRVFLGSERRSIASWNGTLPSRDLPRRRRARQARPPPPQPKPARKRFSRPRRSATLTCSGIASVIVAIVAIPTCDRRRRRQADRERRRKRVQPAQARQGAGRRSDHDPFPFRRRRWVRLLRANRPELRGFLSSGKLGRFAGTGWWGMQELN